MKKKQSKKVSKVWKFISFLMLVLLAVSEGLLFFQIWKLNMLPMKFFAPILAMVLLIDIPLVVMMFPRAGKWQKTKGNGKRMTAYLLSILIAAGSLMGWKMVAKGNETIDHITTAPTVAAQVGVYVLATDKAEKIEDVSRYTFATTNMRDKENTQAAIADIEKIVGKKINVQIYNTLDEMAGALYSGKAQAIILNVAYSSLYNDNEQYSDFSEKTKLIYTYDVKKVEKPTEPPKETVKNPKPAEPTKAVTEQPFVMYLSGSDTRSQTLVSSRSDVNILAVVNPATKQMLLVNTPRDYYIHNPAYGVMDKLTHCGLDGMENSMEALSGLYDCEIDYNAQINFTGFETLIDAIGGITIHDKTGDGVHLVAGDNYMNGEQALDFARDRYSYADGDNARGRHQMQVITAVVEKMSSGAIITNYSKILDSLQGMFVTSMPGDTLRELLQMQMNDMATWNVQSYAVTGEGGMDSTIAGIASVMYPNTDTVEHASKLIDKVLEGKTLSKTDVAPMN